MLKKFKIRKFILI